MYAKSFKILKAFRSVILKQNFGIETELELLKKACQISKQGIS